MSKSYKEKLHNVNTFIFDVDGVLTDGTVLVTTEGELLRRMGVKDGYAIKKAVDQGYRICIITGGTNIGVRKRLEGLGVTDFYMGTHQKEDALHAYCEHYSLTLSQILYMGDDLPDIPPMKRVGIASCPKDAVPEVKEVSHYISHRNGGQGCARDVLEQVLKVRGHWNNDPETGHNR